MQALYWSSYLLLQGILARCMQRTSNVPLWRLYAKQECCEGPSSDLEYEREMLVRLMFLSLPVQAIEFLPAHMFNLARLYLRIDLALMHAEQLWQVSPAA